MFICAVGVCLRVFSCGFVFGVRDGRGLGPVGRTRAAGSWSGAGSQTQCITGKSPERQPFHRGRSTLASPLRLQISGLLRMIMFERLVNHPFGVVAYVGDHARSTLGATL